jgi:cbb3-type cytochrome oxidase subunit 1
MVDKSTAKENGMKASIVSFRAAVLIVLAGIIWGMVMGISQDHSTMPAHAHLNLLGWVSLFLFGVYYHLHPELDLNPLARVQVWIWIVATIILAVGVALVHSGQAAGDPIAAGSSIVVFADMVLFGWLVFRTRKTAQPAPDRLAVPAE